MNRYIWLAIAFMNLCSIGIWFITDYQLNNLKDQIDDVVERTIVVEKRIILHDLN